MQHKASGGWRGWGSVAEAHNLIKPSQSASKTFAHHPLGGVTSLVSSALRGCGQNERHDKAPGMTDCLPEVGGGGGGKLSLVGSYNMVAFVSLASYLAHPDDVNIHYFAPPTIIIIKNIIRKEMWE